MLAAHRPDRAGHAAPGRAAPRGARRARARASSPSYLDAQVGAVYLAEGDGRFRRFAGYGAGRRRAGGRVRRRRRPARPSARKQPRRCTSPTCPAGYLPVVVQPRPRRRRTQLLLAPASVDGVVQAVIELGFFRDGDAGRARAAGPRLRGRSASRCAAPRTAPQLEELLEETQRQAEELQTQQEELRVTNEELEEQGRALQRVAGAARERSRPSSSRPTRSSRSRRSCSSSRSDELLARAGDADEQAPSELRARQPVQDRVPGQHVATSCARRSTAR